MAQSSTAQQPMHIDPRVVSETVQALQSMINLRSAELRATQQDAEKREKDWVDTFAAWCGDRPACGLSAK